MPLVFGLMALWIVAGMVSCVLGVKLRPFRPVMSVLYAVIECGSVHGAAGQQRTDGLKRHAVYMDVVRSELRRAHRVLGTLPAGDRRRAVRAHVRRVMKCLNAAEARIDVDGDHALSALVVFLGQVADRYADGRLGALLDEEKLTDYPPGRDWEALRVVLLAVVIAVVIAVGAVGAGFLVLSCPVTGILIITVGVLGVALLYRKNLAKGMGLLELWRL